ncbi:MAG: D-alanyl-D-alanine carboxypeptidase [Rhodobacteraceae bacterium]|nr:D-alanyl-D-alanine carboxypeptidase [Paracoccaceae bacterium]
MTPAPIRPALALGLAVLLALPVRAFETRATAAYVLDYTTGTVLLDKNGEVPVPPASMSKLMTLLMLFEAIDDGRVAPDTPFAVSSRAKAMGGSTMFLDERDRPTAHDLVLGIIVNSGNDASVVVAEGLGGTEAAFARLMNERAAALGLTGTHLVNASGWPHPEHRMAMRDLVRIAELMVRDHPDLYRLFAETEFAYKGRAPENRFNRNPLLALGLGADGLKTGHTAEAGFGLVGSAVQGGRRVIFAIAGLADDRARREEAEKVINWAFRQFVEREVAPAGRRVAEVPVWMGAAPTVGLVAAEPVRVVLPALARDAVEARVVFRGPVAAPVAAGQPLAELVVTAPDLPERRFPLFAEAGVARGGLIVRLRTAIAVLYDRLAAPAAGL